MSWTVSPFRVREVLHFLSPFPVLYSKKIGGVAISLVFELQTVALKDSGLCLAKSAFPYYKKIIGTMLLCGSVCVPYCLLSLWATTVQWVTTVYLFTLKRLTPNNGNE
jgi:hypothetical protein